MKSQYRRFLYGKEKEKNASTPRKNQLQEDTKHPSSRKSNAQNCDPSQNDSQGRICFISPHKIGNYKNIDPHSLDEKDKKMMPRQNNHQNVGDSDPKSIEIKYKQIIRCLSPQSNKTNKIKRTNSKEQPKSRPQRKLQNRTKPAQFSQKQISKCLSTTSQKSIKLKSVSNKENSTVRRQKKSQLQQKLLESRSMQQQLKKCLSPLKPQKMLECKPANTKQQSFRIQRQQGNPKLLQQIRQLKQSLRQKQHIIKQKDNRIAQLQKQLAYKIDISRICQRSSFSVHDPMQDSMQMTFQSQNSYLHQQTTFLQDQTTFLQDHIQSLQVNVKDLQTKLQQVCIQAQIGGRFRLESVKFQKQNKSLKSTNQLLRTQISNLQKRNRKLNTTIPNLHDDQFFVLELSPQKK